MIKFIFNAVGEAVSDSSIEWAEEWTEQFEKLRAESDERKGRREK